jgi:putative membrane protein
VPLHFLSTMKLLVRWLASTAALLAVAYLFPLLGIDGIMVAGFETALLAGLVLGLVNAILGPVLRLVTKPLSCLTLGLFALVVNAFLFWLAAEIVPGFEVRGALAAFLGAIVYGLLAGAIAGLLGARR